ncbi:MULTISPECIES: polysaccharide biosynthesis/export family protein [Acidobacteriaceae]|uniref:polysaccharide biosynthesis/export family protein n=1 Tax=Acidobacteriaceae TaxID=204434 RepID=UPI00131BDDBE|nr:MULTISPECIES: polysaccharide biosynthesis/export family protein [Acidobacteriaceae]MDW5265280.1 polysaccharide biosynthesis/export family protein [Edaphobacter sp.]
MMKKQNHPSQLNSKEPSRLHVILNRSILAAMLFALSLYPCVVKAQFSGPAVGITEPVNPEVTPTTDAAILYPDGRDIILRQGDLLTVHLYGMTDYEPSARVSLDGTVQLPLIGRLHVEGLTVHQAESLVAARLTSAGMYRDPQVTIQLTEAPSHTITVTGEVHSIIPVEGQKRLFDILAAAGGLPPTASHIVTIDRPGLSQPIVVNLGTDPAKSASANIPVFSGDTVIVPRVGVVYLLGAFKLQGAIPIQENAPLTLMQVAALGGGTGYQGKLHDLRIIRTEGLNRRVVNVDISKVMDGKAPDPVLQADDIVLLPTSAMKAAIKGGGIGTLVGIGSLLILAAER